MENFSFGKKEQINVTNNLEKSQKKFFKPKSVLFISSALLTASILTGCGMSEKEKKVQKAYDDCKKWEYSKKDETEVCKDSSSSHYGAVIFGNSLFNNRSALESSDSYKKNTTNGQINKSSKFNSSNKANSSIKSGGFKSGIGSGGVKGGG